jgi:anti-sigma B factor antagonist
VTLSVTTSTLADGAVEVAPAGEIDVENAYEIREAVAAQLAENRPGRIELNMERVSFIDSTGITAGPAASRTASCG